MSSYIPIDRKFSLLVESNQSSANTDYSLNLGLGEVMTWKNLLSEYRCVILAEAGAGKTKEFEECAKKLENENKFSFFIRIEDIDNDFTDSFEVGDEDSFESWISSTEEAWFFLDSVDEARLDDPRKFHKAIRKFGKKIKSASHRCHIYISSRPYSWRYKEDEDYLNSELIFSSCAADGATPFKIFVLRPLQLQEIRQFCEIRTVSNINALIDEIQRFDLLNLAERPFDLENIISKWNDEGALGSRLDIIQYNIAQRLKDTHTQDRRSIPINFDKLVEGAQRLAAAVILTRRPSIRVPLSQQNNESLDASSILPEWNTDEISRLLESGIFNDIIYGAVRFRHRDVRELLAAQWFAKLLNSDDRLSIEKLFFHEQFGEKIVTPALRTILPWLILFDEKICRTLIAIQPEIAFESGDPSKLPLSVRKQIFLKFIDRIAQNLDDRSVRDNDSIAKIANIDLEKDVCSLIQTYRENDDVIFFLGRMVWQGQLKSCIPLLNPIALDAARDMYSRRVCVRASMACATKSEKIELWTALNQSGETLDRKLIVELIGEMEPDQEVISLLIDSLKNTAEDSRFEYSGLNETLGKFLQKCDDVLAYQLFLGIAGLLAIEPYYERKQWKISKKYAWTLKTAFQIIKKLIESRSPLALESAAIEVLMNAVAVEYQRDYDTKKEKEKIKSIIFLWEKLNDALYWQTIEIERKYYWEQEQKHFTDDWRIYHLEHFWDFNAQSIDRLLSYMKSKDLIDDKLIVLNRAYMVYWSEDKPDWILAKIKDACLGDDVLSKNLISLLNPVVSEHQKRYEEEEQARKIEEENEEAENTQHRLSWIESLRHNPEQLINSTHLQNGELTDNHFWLMREISSKTITTDREEYSDWKALIADFGEPVAKAYRDAAMKLWRTYEPPLHSEENLEKNSTPFAIIFGLAGLQIEANENIDFPTNLLTEEISNALRYITWELNGFPSWLEKFYKIFPTEVIEAVMKEVIWEIETSNSDIEQYYNHILYHLFYHAPWLHVHIATQIFEWLNSHSKLLHKDANKYALQILLNAELSAENFSLLAQQKIAESVSIRDKAWWYALYVDSDPESGIYQLANWLEQLIIEDATFAAQVFICHLVGNRDAINGKSGNDKIKDVKYLKNLYSLMHKYIKPEDDIHRAGKGVYSPGLRDDAQDARDLLFTYLKEVPCAESYYAIKNLAEDNADQYRQIWLRKTAYNIALSCGDLEPWDTEQVLQFESSSKITPKTHKELFNLALLKIHELKDWLENGDDSPWRTWQRVEDETEMRNLIAAELRRNSQNKYTISQENELANSQRTDIRLDNPQVDNPIPIELKLLDKDWSGSKLCERLRNQLVGDYLREATAGCGIFLLVSRKSSKKWVINGSRVSLENLENQLQQYWYTIAHEWPGIDSIKVIVIDLNKRGLVSST